MPDVAMIIAAITVKRMDFDIALIDGFIGPTPGRTNFS
jgi:hypothetical protein